MSAETMRSQRQVRNTALLGTDFMRHYADYRRANAWGTRIDAYRRMSSFNTLKARLLCTQVVLELAGGAHSDRARESFTAETIEMAERTKQSAMHVPAHNPEKLAAMRLLPNVPALLTLYVLQEKPNVLQLEKAFDQHRKGISDSAREVQANASLTQEEVGTAEGQFAESFVLLSLQRFALQKIGDASWLPLPSIGHQDSTHAHGSVLQPTWDVSVYMDTDDNGHELTYKAQVKRGRSSFSSRTQYTEDISLIYAHQDLAFRKETDSRGRSRVEISQLMAEISPDAGGVEQSRWDLRTDKILNILG